MTPWEELADKPKKALHWSDVLHPAMTTAIALLILVVAVETRVLQYYSIPLIPLFVAMSATVTVLYWKRCQHVASPPVIIAQRGQQPWFGKIHAGPLWARAWAIPFIIPQVLFLLVLAMTAASNFNNGGVATLTSIGLLEFWALLTGATVMAGICLAFDYPSYFIRQNKPQSEKYWGAQGVFIAVILPVPTGSEMQSFGSIALLTAVVICAQGYMHIRAWVLKKRE